MFRLAIGPGIFLKDGMVIGAAETKGIHSRPAGKRGAEPWPCRSVDVEGAIIFLQAGIGNLDPQGGRQHLMVQCQHRLDHTGQTGGGFGVADH